MRGLPENYAFSESRILQKKFQCLVLKHVQQFVSGPNIAPVVECVFLLNAVEGTPFLSE